MEDEFVVAVFITLKECKLPSKFSAVVEVVLVAMSRSKLHYI